MPILDAGLFFVVQDASKYIKQPLDLMWGEVNTIVMVLVCMIEPRTNLIVLHEQLPCHNFWMDTGLH